MPQNSYRILVVDDDQIIRDFLVGLLGVKGHQCETAANGVEALEKIEAGTYDMIFTDIVMPKMDGLALTRQIRKKYPSLPVLMMTGFRDQFSEDEALDAGAQDFILKPFTIKSLYRKFEEIMSCPRSS